MRLQIARPRPVPSVRGACGPLQNVSNTCSRFRGSMPEPLSLTQNTHSWPPSDADTRISGGSFPLYLIALPIRFSNKRNSCASLARTTGSGSALIRASDSPIASFKSCIAAEEELRHCCNPAQWLFKIMGDRGCESFQFLIGARQLLRPLPQILL